jgi:hypothetical protein
MQRRLRANVREVTGRTTHANATLEDGVPTAFEVLPHAEWVEISHEPSGVYLCHFDKSGNCIADTWHLTVEDAKDQANFEFGILAGDWQESQQFPTTCVEPRSDLERQITDPSAGMAHDVNRPTPNKGHVGKQRGT